MSNPLAHDLDHVLAHTEGLWEDLRGARVFITGATGFFGCWLLESLLWADQAHSLNIRTVILTRNFDAFCARAPHLARHPSISLHTGNQSDFAFPEGHFDAVIHAAVEYGSPLTTFDTNLQGTRRSLAFAIHSGARRFLFTSSGAVYGPQPRDLERIHEGYTGSPDPSDGASAYGLSKRASEYLGLRFAEAHGLEFKIARCFAFLGPYMPLSGSSAMGNFIRDALSGGPIQVSGDGTPIRSYLYGADLAAWLWTILLKGESGRPYNTGGHQMFSIGELADHTVSALAPGIDVRHAEQPATGLPSRYIPDVGRAKKELGLDAWITLEEAIRRTGQWARSSIRDRIGP